MNEEIEQSNQYQEEQLTCPECGKGFKDMRGLTSHARHSHGINKEELKKILDQDKGTNGWEIIGSLGVFIITIITLGKLR